MPRDINIRTLHFEFGKAFLPFQTEFRLTFSNVTASGIINYCKLNFDIGGKFEHGFPSKNNHYSRNDPSLSKCSANI